MIQQRNGHRRHHREAFHAFALHQRQDLPAIELAHHHMRAAERRERLYAAPAVGVEERNRMQLDHRAQVDAGDDAVGMQVKIAMRQHYALGVRRGSRSVEQLGHGVFVDRHVIDEVRFARGDESFILFQAEDVLHRCEVLSKLVQQRVQLAVVKKHHCSGVVQDEAQFLGREPHV